MTKALVPAAPQSNALAKTTPQTLTVRFPSDRYNVLAPTVHMDGGLPQGTRLVVTEVRIDPSREARETFPISGGALLIGKSGLDKISNAAGISWMPDQRMDDRRHPHYVEISARGRITDFDGTVREISGSKTIDLRADTGCGEPGKDYAAMTSEKQLAEARKFICEIACSKARNRAIASALGIKRAYTADDLRRPFVVPKLALDTSDPVARQIVMANAAGATAALYGSREQVIDAEEVQDDQAQIVDETCATDDSCPPLDTNVEQPPSPDDLYKKAWARYSKAGLPRDKWTTLVKSAVEGNLPSPITVEAATAIGVAVEMLISSKPESSHEPV